MTRADPLALWPAALRLPGVPQTALGVAGREAGSNVSLKAVQRQQVWFYGLVAIRGFPFTGMGLNVFRKALPLLYAVYPIPRDVDFVHAHNHLLQAAIDPGLPGLIAYLALWWGPAYALLAAWRATADPYAGRRPGVCLGRVVVTWHGILAPRASVARMSGR